MFCAYCSLPMCWFISSETAQQYFCSYWTLQFCILSSFGHNTSEFSQFNLTQRMVVKGQLIPHIFFFVETPVRLKRHKKEGWPVAKQLSYNKKERTVVGNVVFMFMFCVLHISYQNGHIWICNKAKQLCSYLHILMWISIVCVTVWMFVLPHLFSQSLSHFLEKNISLLADYMTILALELQLFSSCVLFWKTHS